MDTLTADEAAARLGVRKHTLYTYASRGLVRTVAEGRRRFYVEADVEALAVRAAAAGGHDAAASSSMDWGAPILESAITSIDVDGPNYRGVPAVTLAEQDVAFERVCELLWGAGRLPDEASFAAADLGVDPDALRILVPPGTPPCTALAVAVAALAAADPHRHGVSDEVERAAWRVLIRRMAAAAALCGPRRRWRKRLDAALVAPTVAGALRAALGGPRRADRWIGRMLVLCADHELNASSFAARIAAGTGSDALAAVGAALAALSGPRHGGMSDRVDAVLEAVPTAQAARAWVAERFRLGEEVPGYRHRLYPEGDPRAASLLADAAAVDPDRVAGLLAVVREMEGRGHGPPVLDVGLVALAAAAGLPRGSAAAIFAVGRTAGWLAHAHEQRASGRMLRPRARYVGP